MPEPGGCKQRDPRSADQLPRGVQEAVASCYPAEDSPEPTRLTHRPRVGAGAGLSVAGGEAGSAAGSGEAGSFVP